MADTPRELDRVNSILLTDDVLASGPRTPWSPIRGSTGRRPGPIAATRLLDLDDEGFERPAEYSGRGAATLTLLQVRIHVDESRNIFTYISSIQTLLALVQVRIHVG